MKAVTKAAELAGAQFFHFGTMGDFIEFTHGAKQRGIRVIISSLITPPTNIAGFKKHAAIRNLDIATGTCVRKSGHRMLTRAWCFLVCRNRLGPRDPVAKQWYFHSVQLDFYADRARVRSLVIKF